MKNNLPNQNKINNCKNLFVAATRQNDGKTSVSVGLYNAFGKRFKHLSYMKPVGQQYRIVDGEKIDKDAVLFSKVYDIKDPLSLMSPIAVEKGFTQKYILNPEPEKIHNQIKDAYQKLSQNKDFILVEGTGHAGVGSVFDASNGQVARLLGSKVVLVSPGGVGKAIDEIMMNKACFEREGVEVMGVIVNKIYPNKYEEIKNVVEKGLARFNLPLLGAIPFVNMLSNPTLAELSESLKAEVLANEDRLSNRVERVLIGAMAAHDAIHYFDSNTVLIVPGNREEIIMTALFTSMIKEEKMGFNISGMIFTGGTRPHEKIFELINHAKIPVLLVDDDSYTVAARINNMIVKIQPSETEKIEKIQSLIEEYVDVDLLCERL